MKYITNTIGTTYLDNTEITWVITKRVFTSAKEQKQYKWNQYQEMLKAQ